MVSTDEDSSIRYRFGPLERRGVVAGWRGGQLATVGAGLLAGVLALRADATLSGALVALVVLGISIALSTWPVGGRTLEEWAPDAVRYAAGTRRRAGARLDPFRSLHLTAVELDTPRGRAVTPRLGATRPVDAAGSDGRAKGTAARAVVGVIVDRAARTYTVSFGAQATGFVLLAPHEQCRRVEAWAGALASLARDNTAVHRVQWTSRTLPVGSTGGRRRRSGTPRSAPGGPAATRGAPGGIGDGHTRGEGEDCGQATCDPVRDGQASAGWRSAARRSYGALEEAQARSAQRREVVVSVSVHAGRAARAVRAAGGGERGACTLVLREAASLRRRLAAAGIHASDLLAPEALEDVVRGAFSQSCPDDGEGGAAPSRWAGTDAAAGMPRERFPWPMAVRPEWGRVLVEGTWHATYWVSEWPRTDVGPDFLAPLLLSTGVRHAVSVVMEPLGPVQAARRLEQARTADIADAELRRRGGFLATARRRREEQVLVRRESELADGHAPFRFSGYVTVSAGDADELEEGCAATEQAAARCGLELRLCYGDQPRAFTATLPLGRGLA